MIDKITINEEAMRFIKTKSNMRDIIKQLFNEKDCIERKNPITMFMAGSPGAGKTEFSKYLIEILKTPCLRIDADDIRKLLPNYDGSNADQLQSASSVGVDKLYDYVIKHSYSALIDGTLSSYSVAERNIKRALSHERKVSIWGMIELILLKISVIAVN